MSDYELECSFFERKLSNKVVELEKVKSSNGKLSELQSKYNRLLDLSNELEAYRADLSVLGTAVVTENNSYRKQRIAYLNDVITDAVKEVFPNENYKASIICDFDRKDKAYLILTDAAGHVHHPQICEGKLMQYLLSFAAVSGITGRLGYNNLFIDEAFGVAASDILPDIGEVIQRKIDEGFQIILVSQNPALYMQLPRHEIHLEKNPSTEKVEVSLEQDI